MMPWKTVRVHYSIAPKTMAEPVELMGILPSEKLAPKMAILAAHVWCGHRSGVTVWDNEFHHGYRLYARSARKLTQS